MTEAQVIVNNLKIQYKVFGQGRPFLILHGWGSQGDRWQKIAELLEAQNLKLVIPDLPGFGQSQQPPLAWSLDDYVEWVKDFSQTVPELNRAFYLLGHSFGGTLSAKFAIKYNQRVEKLFLISAACIRKNTAIKKIFYRLAKMVKLFSFMPYYQEFRKAVYKFIIRKSDYPYASDVMQEVYLRAISDDLSHKLSFIKNKTYIIFGEKDTITPIIQAKIIHQKISNSKLIIIPGADHSLHLKTPEILAEKILENI